MIDVDNIDDSSKPKKSINKMDDGDDEPMDTTSPTGAPSGPPSIQPPSEAATLSSLTPSNTTIPSGLRQLGYKINKPSKLPRPSLPLTFDSPQRTLMNKPSGPPASLNLGAVAGRTRRVPLSFATPATGSTGKQFDFKAISPQQINSPFSEDDFKENRILRLGNETYICADDDLDIERELGSGSYGTVDKVKHKPSNKWIAVKTMNRTGNPEEEKRIMMDLGVVLNCSDYKYIVQCYGYIIRKKDVRICMELVATCFSNLLKHLRGKQTDAMTIPCIPELVIGKIAVATVNALHYLKQRHDVIHRDVKPSNILINELGEVKLCDFGISGRLVDSMARTQVGCCAYISPERIDPKTKDTYDIRADVWSLGITLYELAMGQSPHSDCKDVFDVSAKILTGDPPRLSRGPFSRDFLDFTDLCLQKNVNDRPKYPKLLEHPFIKNAEKSSVDMKAWFASVVAPLNPPGALLPEASSSASARS